jgi:membrane protease YdiL (CAAX protease family)
VPARPPFTVYGVFFGRDGLHPIWGVLLFFLIREIINDAIWFLALPHLPPQQFIADPSQPQNSSLATPLGLFIGEGIALLSILSTIWIMARIERRPVATYGYAPSRAVPNFLIGLITGFALLSLLILVLHASGLIVFDARLLFGRAALRYGAVWLGGFLLVAVVEESYSRGYLQFTLTRLFASLYARFLAEPRTSTLSFWSAALVLSCLFASGHTANPGESPLGIFAAGLIGLVFCLSLWRTGSLWWAIGFHAAWDWAQSFFYGVADSGIVAQGRLFATHPAGSPWLSGGLTGPEGSLFLLPVAGLTALLILALPGAKPQHDGSTQPQAHLNLDLS